LRLKRTRDRWRGAGNAILSSSRNVVGRTEMLLTSVRISAAEGGLTVLNFETAPRPKAKPSRKRSPNLCERCGRIPLAATPNAFLYI
jgi:hypothetical protein